jgi:excisionase family DNA binding protein
MARDDASTLTTTDVANLLHVAPRTAALLIDSGQIAGYRIGVSAGRSHRRVPRVALVAFAAARGIPLNGSVPAMPGASSPEPTLPAGVVTGLLCRAGLGAEEAARMVAEALEGGAP